VILDGGQHVLVHEGIAEHGAGHVDQGHPKADALRDGAGYRIRVETLRTL
jgi:hypothetical protein